MLSALSVIVGVALVALSLQDAFEVVLLPRRVRRRLRIMRVFFSLTWRGWRAVGLRLSPGQGREAVLGVYGPLAMMMLFGTWALGIILGFALLQWPLTRPPEPGWDGLARALLGSGDAFFTLGYDPAVARSAWLHALILLEAGTGFSAPGRIDVFNTTQPGRGRSSRRERPFHPRTWSQSRVASEPLGADSEPRSQPTAVA